MFLFLNEYSNYISHTNAFNMFVALYLQHTCTFCFTQVAYSLGMDRVFSGSRDKTAKMWSREGAPGSAINDPVQSFVGHNLVVTGIAPGEKLIRNTRALRVVRLFRDQRNCELIKQILGV